MPLILSPDFVNLHPGDSTWLLDEVEAKQDPRNIFGRLSSDSYGLTQRLSGYSYRHEIGNVVRETV